MNTQHGNAAVCVWRRAVCANRAVMVAALLMAAMPGGRGEDAVEGQAQQAAKRDADALGWLLRQGLRQMVIPQQAEQPQQAVRIQLMQQINQQAKQVEQMLAPVLASELEMVRQACGDLEPVARKPIHAAGQTALKAAARGMAERQLTGRFGQDAFDPRLEIRGPIVKALGAAAPEHLAAYQQEQESRTARQARAARLRIVATLDGQLDLSEAQRQAIEADLEKQWDAAWVQSLVDSGLINDQPIAPDFAAAAIEPHLATAQNAAWKDWCRDAGSKLVGRRFMSWHFDGQGLQGTDNWWTP
jgi:hypothetical protein